MDFWMILLLGAIGGFLPDLIRVAKAAGDFSYWRREYVISVIALVIVGAIAAWLTDLIDGTTTQPSAIAALTAGFAGPEVLSRLLSKSDDGAGDRTGTSSAVDVRDWWSV